VEWPDHGEAEGVARRRKKERRRWRSSVAARVRVQRGGVGAALCRSAALPGRAGPE
jgi:hypothetical protein